jgi:hypothetical protein
MDPFVFLASPVHAPGTDSSSPSKVSVVVVAIDVGSPVTILVLHLNFDFKDSVA